jgi:hypothetical protein
MNENPTPNHPPPSDEQRRIKELEAEVARLRGEPERANEFREGYKAFYAAKEDWGQVEKKAFTDA